MAIYIIIFLLFFVSSILEVGGLKKNQAIWILYALAGVLVLFVGLRYNTGGDWFMYKQVFNNSLSSNDNLIRHEYGYILFNKIFKMTFNNYYVMQFTATLFFIYVITKFYKKESPYPVVSLSIMVCFFLYSILMSQIRQSIAISIIILSSKYIFDRKFLPFLLTVIIACFFHIAAIAAVPLYFLYRNYSKILSITLIIIAQIFYFSPQLLNEFILFIAPYLPDRLSTIATNYMSSYFARQAEFKTGLFYLARLFLTIFLVLYINPKDNKTSFFMNSLTIIAIIKGLSIGIEIIGRVESFYVVYAVIAFTYFCDVKIKNIKQTKLLFTSIVILLFAVMPMRSITSTAKDKLTGRPENYSMTPYYNCIIHPKEATLRKDWNQE